MKRRQFLSRIAKAATAFAIVPGVFKALPAARNMRCVVAASYAYDNCGSITRASISHLTPEQLDKLFAPHLEELDKYFAEAIKIDAQFPRTGIYDWALHPKQGWVATNSGAMQG